MLKLTCQPGPFYPLRTLRSPRFQSAGSAKNYEEAQARFRYKNFPAEIAKFSVKDSEYFFSPVHKNRRK
jgi:hypothetical protein